MDLIERVMRVMTHINIGAALGLVAWVLWSGWQDAAGPTLPALRAADASALLPLAQTGPSRPLQLVPAGSAAGPLPVCPPPPTAPRQAADALTGADL